MKRIRLPFAGLAGLVLASLSGQAQLIIQNRTYNSGDSIGLIGPTTIQTSGTVTVSSGANVTYQAETSITLQPGFTAVAGSNFQAVATGSLSGLSGFSTGATTEGTLTISWSAPSNTTGIVGYYVYRNNLLIGSTTTTSFTDTGLRENTTYNYVVAAYGSSGQILSYLGTFSGTTNTQIESQPGLNLFVPNF